MLIALFEACVADLQFTLDAHITPHPARASTRHLQCQTYYVDGQLPSLCRRHENSTSLPACRNIRDPTRLAIAAVQLHPIRAQVAVCHQLSHNIAVHRFCYPMDSSWLIIFENMAKFPLHAVLFRAAWSPRLHMPLACPLAFLGLLSPPASPPSI